MICYDCQRLIIPGQEILETRQTSGPGMGETGVFEGDFSKVLVHADRRICQKNLEEGYLCDVCNQSNKTGGGYVLRNKAGERVLRHYEKDCEKLGNAGRIARANG